MARSQLTRQAAGMQIVLVDDQAEVRAALRLLLEQEDGLTVAAEAAGVDALMELVRARCPDVVLLDWELVRGRPLVAELRAACPGVAIIALSGRPEARADATAKGARAFVSKGDPPERLLEALRGLETPSSCGSH